MKLDSIKKLVTSEEIHEHIQGLWKTDMFRVSHKEHGFVHDVVDSFSTMPCFFFDCSDEHLEKAHFATWWRGIMNREYPGAPYIHDLYLLHELFHGGDLVFKEDLSHESFKRKMNDNELGASVCSEIEAYFRLPGLREKSFPEEIYADRFLNDPEIQKRWEIDPARMVKEFRVHRQDIMMGDSRKKEDDAPAYWIKQFVHQNDAWAIAWVHNYNEVEKAMVQMRRTVDAGDRVLALENHMNWLTSEEVMLDGDIPFPNEAKMFAASYWGNKAAYERDNRPKPVAAPALSADFAANKMA